MLCSISGEPAQVPVISTKSQRIYEKRLIEAHITEKGTDPVTGQESSLDDLIEVKDYTPVVKPRPGSLTSIPSLLGALQSEWDAMVLETFQLKQQLVNTKQELSSALYHHDAAVRVAARLTKERNEARQALADLSASVGQPQPAAAVSNGSGKDAHQDDDVAMSEDVPVPTHIQEAIQSKAGELKKSRKAKAAASGDNDQLQTPDLVGKYTDQHKTKQLFSTVSNHSLSVSPVNTDLVLTGGGKSQAGVYSLEQQSVVSTIKCAGNITAAKWTNDGQQLVVGIKTGKVQVFNFESEKLTTEFNEIHSSKVISVDVLPIGLVVSASAEKYALHDIESGETVFQRDITSGTALSASVHPDGVLLAVGTSDQNVLIYDLTTGEVAATFEVESSPVDTIAFSENGYFMACGGTKANSAYIFHLGKQTLAHTIVLDGESTVSGLRFDHSGQYLAIASSSGVHAAWFNKPEKKWQKLFDVQVQAGGAIAADWTRDAKELVAITAKGSIHVLY